MSEKKSNTHPLDGIAPTKEFTARALIIGLVLSIVLGAANAYLGLKAGMTIAATYPAAVISMAILRILQGSILEENFARTVGSIGESVAAGAIFTIPAFYISGIWPDFFTTGHYFTSVLILLTGGLLGIMFVALLRKVMVQDKELPYPESIAAAEIHNAGRSARSGSKNLFIAMIVGALIQAFGQLKLFLISWEQFFPWFKSTFIPGTTIKTQGGMLMSAPAISPAYMGVGYIIGPRLGSLNFSGGLIAWGLMVPLIYYFISPYFDASFLNQWAQLLINRDGSLSIAEATEKVSSPDFQFANIWRFIVRPIAIGGMLTGAVFTLFKMRKSLTVGLKRSINDIRKVGGDAKIEIPRTEQDLPFRWILAGIIFSAVLTFIITFFIFHSSFFAALVASTVMIVLAFFFAAISGYLVGTIGSSNNPISGLTLTALVLTALILVSIGVDASSAGVEIVLGVAAIVCISAAVAGEMLQDLKAGHILGGTPKKMQIGDIIGVIAAAGVMFLILQMLNQADINQGKMEGYEGGFGSKNLSAPQAGLMAMLSKGIIGGDMAWPLIIFGVLMGIAFILMGVKSPMLVSVGIYLPLETTFAIFIGGLVKGVVDIICEKRGYDKFKKEKVENTGILIASGLIAGEALTGLAFAPIKIANIPIPAIFKDPPLIIGFTILALVVLYLIRIPLKSAEKEITEPTVKVE